MTSSAQTAGLSLGELERELSRFGARVIGAADARVRDVRQDSRQVEVGELFAARAGAAGDALAHVPDAVRRGAGALMVPEGSAAQLASTGLPLIEVSDVRAALPFAAEAVHGHPSHDVAVVGITGTNGKTTSAWLLQSALCASGIRTARLGTLGYAFESDGEDSPLTTPEPDLISRKLAALRASGGTHLVMEVSSHALVQSRVEALRFAVAAFTNLTQDHLDFHEDMRSYAAAKARLFLDLSPAASVINVDDTFGAELAERVQRCLRVARHDASADVRPVALIEDGDGFRGRVRVAEREVTLESRLVGDHNVDNVLLCLGVASALGLDVQRVADGLSQATGVPGRLERCDEPGDGITVLVDYAHTPDALSRALAAVRRTARGQVWCVFGCGGDRDPAKRPLMGRAVAVGADRAIVTNDNPRSEDPLAIARAIEPGLAGARYEVELDRARAIERAVLAALPGDVVLIAGKGHETYQIVGATRRDFDDRVEARRALRLRRER